MLREILLRRFADKIAPDPQSDCILWTAACRKGYGLLHVDGKLVPATHVSWFLKYGVWPTLKMLHRCDNPPCVNPDHLFEGTDADNAADRDAKGRHCTPSGFDVATAKLTGLEVSEIVALTDTRMSNAEIGVLFGVSAVYVSSLRHGRYRTTPSGRKAKPKASETVEIGGRSQTILEWAAEAGLREATVRRRVRRGLVGDAIIAPRHQAPRKPYVRRR